MTDRQWNAFNNYCETLENLCNKWNKYEEVLYPLQKEASKKDTPDYNLETAVVYNTAYREITKNDEIHYIVIGDNPGKDEQKACNRKYFVGQSGKLGAGFFAKNPILNTDFRKNVIISNKTPIHTAKTTHLKYLEKNGSNEIRQMIYDSQTIMAQITAKLHQELIDGCEDNSFIPELWLVGYGELKNKGIFSLYRETLKNCYTDSNCMTSYWDKVKVYQHFSMNCFNKDIQKFNVEDSNKNNTLKQNLDLLGTKHRKEIFGI